MREPNWEALECFDASRKPRQSPPVAQYEVVKNYKRLKKRHLNIRICRHGFTVFLCPCWGDDPPVREIMKAKGAWMNNRMQSAQFRPFYNGMWVEILGSPINCKPSNTPAARTRSKDARYSCIDAGLGPRDIRDKLAQFLRAFAQPWLERRFHELANQHGFEGPIRPHWRRIAATVGISLVRPA